VTSARGRGTCHDPVASRRPLACALVVFVSPQACSSQPTEPAAKCDPVELLVVASDYSSSAVGGAPPSGRAALTTGLDLGKDPQLALSNGRAFCLARDADLLFELDGSCGTPKSRVSVHDQAVGGRPANPHDVAAAPDGTLFVALYNVGKLAVVEGGRVTGSIDLSSYDGDGNPQAESVRILTVGGAAKAFVALERLDDKEFPLSKQPSMMLRVDVATRRVEASVVLAGRNPFNPMAEHDGALFLAEPRSFDAADEDLAGIERFDTQTSTTRLLVAERALGGSVADVAVTSGCGAAIVAGPEKDVNPTFIVLFDPSTGQVFERVLGPTPGYDLQGLAWRGDRLYVGDRREGPGGYPIHVFERDGDRCALRATDLTISLPQRPIALRAAR
jgi:hypothetical protein